MIIIILIKNQLEELIIKLIYYFPRHVYKSRRMT